MSLPNLAHARQLIVPIKELAREEPELFADLFNHQRNVAGIGKGYLDPLVREGLLNNNKGQLSSPYRITKLFDLFILTDSPSYYGCDRVWYLLEDETLLFARSIGDCVGKKVLDIGCGSGALSLVAARNGASAVTALDISPRAVQFTKFNIALNGVNNISAIECRIEDHEPPTKYDYVLLNPPFVPVPDGVKYVTSGSGGKDGLTLVRKFLNRMDAICERDLGLSLISMSPGTKFISELELLLLQRFADRTISMKTLDIYQGPTTIERALTPFKLEPTYSAWVDWLSERKWEYLHYLYINIVSSAKPHFSREFLTPALQPTPESGDWEAMYAVIENSKRHAQAV